MQFTYRPASMDDVAELNGLIPESVRALSPGYYTPAQIERAIQHIFGVDSQLIADGTYYVAEADGRLVGCGGWSRRRTLFGGDQMKGSADDRLDPARDPARIRAYFVRPEWARRGIGRRIIEMCESAARADGFQAMELVATLPGEPLYAALGYRVTRYFEIPMADDEGLPAAHMVKELE